MDCTIPSHSVRTFSAAVVCASRVGKDLYMEFDASTGLRLSTLTDAKTCFLLHEFAPSFFERCSAPPLRKRKNATQDSDSTSPESYSCRVPLRAMSAITKARKNVQSLRIRNEDSSEHAYLSFEFVLHNTTNLLRVVHRIGISDAVAVTASELNESPKTKSTFSSSPKFLLSMLEPLKKTPEIALICRPNMVTMTSFHHHNALLQTPGSALLKTETSVSSDEFHSYEFQGYRRGTKKDYDANDDEHDDGDAVANEITLVFSLRELKALLQFAASIGDSVVDLSYYWGGKPLVVTTSCMSLKCQLVVATLDSALVDTSTTEQGGGRE